MGSLVDIDGPLDGSELGVTLGDGVGLFVGS